jgi:elongation factor 1 alpha-like protein
MLSIRTHSQNPDLSPEDQEHMRVATIAVKAALGSTIIVTDKEIQDALWHYFYDIDQSVTYLQSESRDLSNLS